MPFSTISGARKRVSSLKNKTDKQVKVFISVFNSLVAKGESEDSAIPKAIAAANKVKKSMDGEKLRKNTNNDFRRMVQSEVQSKFNGYVQDHDQEFIYYEVYDHDENAYESYKIDYQSHETGVDLGDNPIPVVMLTEYRDVVEKATKKEGSENLSTSDYAYVPDSEKPSTWKLRIDDATHVRAAVAALGKGFRGNKVSIPSEDLSAVKSKVRRAYKKFFPDKVDEDGYPDAIAKSNEETPSWFKKFLNNFVNEQKDTTTQVIKQFDDDQMIAIEPLYVSVGEVDGQGDFIEDIQEMEDLVKSFNESNESGILQTSLFHGHKTEAFKIIKAWVNQCDCYIGEELVPEGQPIAKIQFINEKAWELRKQGILTGLSIGARAQVEEVNDE